ncbi:hypothetical protein [Paenibacillus sp. Soil787]|uniref:hypothetical protein n=1 Tax=Paenibacillus sp. Soil787 TaxID=1736411 RepID=UPI0012E3EAF6|nr:hypothetical protein [Paenibacillus sp. Soil787]
MNTKLLCHYNNRSLKEWLEMDVSPREIEEITSEDFQKFIEEMNSDFEIIEQNKDCGLEVYNFDEIIEYIRLSKSKAMEIISSSHLLVLRE